MSNTDKDRGIVKMMAGTFALIIVTCIAIALFAHSLDLFVISSALNLAFITGIFLTTKAVAISFVKESRPTAFCFFDGGYHLAGHLIAAIIPVMRK